MDIPLIEGCVDSYTSCVAAFRGGADRLELCANLAIGGTTPSLSLFQQVQRDCPIPVNVLIRPRFGDFLYTEAEVEEMQMEISRFREMGANGVVIGALTPEGELDGKKMRRLMDCAKGMEVTLHRAFDMTRDPFSAMEAAVRLGCRTILTSGQASNALEGAPLLGELVSRADDRIQIMAGCGVRRENIRAIHQRAGVRAFHTSAKGAPLDSGMIYRKPGVSMGLPSLSEYQLWQTDRREFEECARIVHGLGTPG